MLKSLKKIKYGIKIKPELKVQKEFSTLVLLKKGDLPLLFTYFYYTINEMDIFLFSIPIVLQIVQNIPLLPAQIFLISFVIVLKYRSQKDHTLTPYQ